MDQDARSTVRMLVRILGIVAVLYGLLALLFAGHLSLLNPPWLRVPVFEPEGAELNGMIYIVFGLVLLLLSRGKRSGSEPSYK